MSEVSKSLPPSSHLRQHGVPKVQAKVSNISDVMQDVDLDLMEKFQRFRILIIGRANAGKTTILQKICNATEDPEIYDDRGTRVCFMRLELFNTDVVNPQSGRSCGQGVKRSEYRGYREYRP